MCFVSFYDISVTGGKRKKKKKENRKKNQKDLALKDETECRHTIHKKYIAI